MIVYALIFAVFFSSMASDAYDMQVTALKHAKMKLKITVPQKQTAEIKEIADVLMRAFSYSGQFDVSIAEVDVFRTKDDIKQWSSKGFPLIVHVCLVPRGVEWRLYNTIDGKMLKGKKYKKLGTLARGWAYNIADQIWLELTAQPGFFSSKIAYCKQVERDEKQNYKHVYIADFDGSHEEPLVQTATVNVGARFNEDPHNCLVFYSQFTNENVELRVTDMWKKTRSISAFDGVNMLPAFSEDGKKVAYCASKGTGSCQIYYFANKKLTQITDNEGNNISPALTNDGKKIYFCSDINRVPSLYCFDRESRSLERLTSNASSMSPTYCVRRDQLAYCKKTNGLYQVFTYDCKGKEHMQQTFGPGHKSECSWSPCGNYILYAAEKDHKQHLETVNMLSGAIQHIAVTGNCSYPTWSRCYRQFPVVS